MRRARGGTTAGLDDDARRGFEQRTYAHLRKYFPRHCLLLGESRMRLVIRAGAAKAGHYGLDAERCRRTYIELMCLLGSGFDTDPLLPWATETLHDPVVADEVTRSDRLHERAWAYIAHVARDYRDARGEPTTARFVDELRALRCETTESPSDHDFPEFADSLGGRLERVFPAKVGYVGRERVRELIPRARARAKRYGITSARGLVLPQVARARDLEVRVTFSNGGSSPIRLNVLLLQSATVVLRLRQADGTPVRPGPPPVPPVDDGQAGRLTLAPGESATFVYYGRDYLAGGALAPGTYQVQFHHEALTNAQGDWAGLIESPWLDVEVGGSPPGNTGG